MPKIVDHDARRTELAEAMWRVVRRDGVGAATVRAVAAEAGWSPGALRHYFTTQTELLVFAMEHVISQARRRVDAGDYSGPTRQAVRSLLEEVLPLDAERAREAEVWLLLTGRTLVDRAGAELLRKADDGVRRAAEVAVAALADDGLLAPGRDAEIETARLHALLDGLTVHALTRPDVMPPERVSALLGAHLDDLTT